MQPKKTHYSDRYTKVTTAFSLTELKKIYRALHFDIFSDDAYNDSTKNLLDKVNLIIEKNEIIHKKLGLNEDELILVEQKRQNPNFRKEINSKLEESYRKHFNIQRDLTFDEKNYLFNEYLFDHKWIARDQEGKIIDPYLDISKMEFFSFEKQSEFKEKYNQHFKRDLNLD